MSQPSPLCTVNGLATGSGVDVTTPSTVTVTPADHTGITVWTLRALYTDDLLDAETVTAAITMDSATKIATFAAPAAGSCIILESCINSGVDSNDATEAAYRTTFKVHTLTAGGFRVFAQEETDWLSKLNALARAAT